MDREVVAVRSARLDGEAFFSPNDMAVLKEAVEHARYILSSNGVGEGYDTPLILAEGVLAAAQTGEREMIALSFAACRFWIDTSRYDAYRKAG